MCKLTVVHIFNMGHQRTFTQIFVLFSIPFIIFIYKLYAGNIVFEITEKKIALFHISKPNYPSWVMPDQEIITCPLV